jgi:large subunit ribosomal protein L21
MYAIIATGGKQYKVSEGDVIRVEKLGKDADETVTFDQVLAVRDDDTLKVGKDVENASVTATVTANGKGKKVIVYKYKRKTGYHKKNGHRQQYTEVKIDKINA